MTYNVGMILYVVSRTSAKVLPVLVVEEIIKKTLNSDNEISYNVMLPGKTEAVRLETLNADIYPTAQKAREALFENLSKNVSAIVDAAEQVAQETWPRQIVNNKPPVVTSATTDINNDEEIGVILPGGVTARVRQPRSKKQPPTEQ